MAGSSGMHFARAAYRTGMVGRSQLARWGIEHLAPDLLAGVLPRIYPPMLEEVRAHQDAGRATFIVSAAGNGLVEILARVLGMDGGIGTRYEVGGNGLR